MLTPNNGMLTPKTNRCVQFCESPESVTPCFETIFYLWITSHSLVKAHTKKIKARTKKVKARTKNRKAHPKRRFFPFIFNTFQAL